MTRYKLAIFENYNTIIHGNSNLDLNIDKYIITYLIYLDEFYEDEYKNIMLNMEKNVKFGIVEPYYKNDVMLCNIKTDLLVKLQIKWKKKCKEKKEFIEKCKSFKNIKYREIHGKFPKKNLF